MNRLKTFFYAALLSDVFTTPPPLPLQDKKNVKAQNMKITPKLCYHNNQCKNHIINNVYVSWRLPENIIRWMVLRVGIFKQNQVKIFLPLDHVCRTMSCDDMLWSLTHLISIGGIGCLRDVLKPALYHKHWDNNSVQTRFIMCNVFAKKL